MTYYAFIENNTINGRGECRQLTEGVLNYEVSEYIYNNIEDYIWNGEDVVIDPELNSKKLEKAKEAKIEENDTKRDIALNNGVTYREVLFDSDTDQKVNLLATVSTIGDEETIVWYGMDNQPLECTKEDLVNIGGLITSLHSFCWNKNAEIKNQIAEAHSLEDVEAIEINYIQEDNEVNLNDE